MDAAKARKAPVRRSVDERRTALLSAKNAHMKHIKTIDNKLAQLDGKVTTASMRDVMQKWLEGMTSPDLKKHAHGLGIDDPELFDDLDILTEAILNKTIGGV